MTSQPSSRGEGPNSTDARRVFPSVAFAHGPADVLEFLLPLWAGAALAATPAQTGWLVAAASGAAVIARPLAARAVDRGRRLGWAALGSACFTVSLLGYALSEAMWMAFVATVVCGVGNAFFWIAVRSWVGTSSSNSISAYGRLLRYEGQGSLAAYVMCFVLLGQIGYSYVFALGALSCLAATVLLLKASSREGEPAFPEREQADTPLKRTFPFLTLCAVTAAVESGIALVLLIHLQQGLGFTVYEVAYVLAPGFLVFILVPAKAEAVTRRTGVAGTITLTLAMSALLGWTLVFSPSPLVIAVVWAAYCACLGLAVPTEQAVVSGTSGRRIGRGMSRYENSQLVGAAAGSVAFGAMYGANGLPMSGLVAGTALALCALSAPYLLRRLPREVLEGMAPERTLAQKTRRPASRNTSTQTSPTHETTDSRKRSARDNLKDYAHARKTRVHWFQHLVLFTVGQAILWFFDLSALAEYLTGEDASGTPHILVTLGRLWIIVFAVDTVWSWYFTFFPREVQNEKSE
ncbi:MFS transporter [Nocardiopsis terrae]